MTLLLTLLFIKHFLADFVFQTEWMVKGKGLESGWLLPLYCHASVHQIFTLAILFFYVDISTAIVVAFLEKVAHIIIDRYKDISRPAFWNALGADQLAHALSYIAIATYVI
jgi:hypothetical protein